MRTVYYQSIRDSSDSEDFTEPSKAGGVTLAMDEDVQLLRNEHPLPLKLRVFAFIMCGMNITFQYLYYTAPIAFLSNELIEVDAGKMCNKFIHKLMLACDTLHLYIPSAVL